MDFIKNLLNQPLMFDPAQNAKNLMSGLRQSIQKTTPELGGYDPNSADLLNNTQALLDPNDLVKGGYEPLPSLLSNQNTSSNTNTYGEADLTLDTTNNLTSPVNESRYTPTNTNIGPSLLTTRQEDKSPERVINDIANQAVLDNGQRIGQEPLYKVPPKTVEQQALENPSLMAIQPLIDRYGGNRDMALIAKRMGPELMDGLLSTYGVKWKDHLTDYLKQFLIDNNAY